LDEDETLEGVTRPTARKVRVNLHTGAEVLPIENVPPLSHA
jgi:hypothetical protein